MRRLSAIFATLALGTCQSTTRRDAPLPVDQQERVQKLACDAASHSFYVYAQWSGKPVHMEQVGGKDAASACCQVLVGGKLGTEVCLTERTEGGRFLYDYRRTVRAH